MVDNKRHDDPQIDGVSEDRDDVVDDDLPVAGASAASIDDGSGVIGDENPDEELASDFVDVAREDVPEELREDRPDPDTLPRTGLVSEFHDLSASQAAYLVAHRETSSVSRSPLFYVSALVLGLAVIGALVIGFQRAGTEVGGASETLAVVGVEQAQADAFSQQIGLPVVSVEDQEAGEAMLRSGEAGAVYVLDPTGMQEASLLALDRDPQAILDRLNQPIPVDYLDAPAVAPAVGDPVAWGMAVVVVLAALALGAALYQNLRTEKRNRLAEVIASTIPARSSAWGRVYGLALLSITYPLIAAGILLVGLSIGQRTDIAVGLLPALGWFTLIAVVTVFIVLGAHLWVATNASRRMRQVGYGLVVLLTLAGALAPLLLRSMSDVILWLSYVPFSAPVAMPMRYFANQADWWEGLAAAAVSALIGALVFWFASAAYRRTLLKGAGRSGRKAAVKARRRSTSTATERGSTAAEAASAKVPASGSSSAE